MKTFTNLEIREALNNASEAAKDVIFAGETADVIGVIIDEFHLPEELGIPIAEEVLFVMLGLTTIAELPAQLTERINVESNIAAALAEHLSVRVIARGNQEESTSVPVKIVAEAPENEETPEQTFESAQPTEVPAPQTLDSVPVSEAEIRERLHLKPETTAPASPEQKPEEVHHAPAAATRTMQQDIEAAQSGTAVPRYAKPLTETSGYGDSEENK